jgi:hypothetical protein
MRTKALFVAAALAVATVATSVAQVTYSVNAVGYVKVPAIPANSFAMICNPLNNTTGNTVANLFPNAPEGTFIYKFIGGAYEQANLFEFGEWGNPSQELLPGEGAFLKTPAGAGYDDLVFVGEGAQGDASNVTLEAGFNMVGSLVPQAGLLSTDLAYPADEGDFAYLYDVATQNYMPAYLYEFGEWAPSEPSLEVAEAAFLKPTGTRAWDRNFSVND